MKRLFWLGVGLAVGALVVRAVTKRASSFTPQGIAGAVRASGQNAVDSVRDFLDDVRDTMHEREEELYTALASGRPVGAGSGEVAGFEDEFQATLDQLDAAFEGPPMREPGSTRHSTEDTSR